MLPLTHPVADGGYAHDSDLHQMSDDGCPLGPNPARWADPAWRDAPAADPPAREGASEPAAGPTYSRWQRLQNAILVTERWRLACARIVRDAKPA
jgi:hypothetical protein